MCSLNKLHWEQYLNTASKSLSKKSCVMQKRALADQMANTLIFSRCIHGGNHFTVIHTEVFTVQQNDFSQDLPSKGVGENNYNLLITKN